MRLNKLSVLGSTLFLIIGLGGIPANAEEDVVQWPWVEVGEQAPSFSLTTTAGQTLSPEDLQGEKLLVLTFFRGTW
jgi:hypothetical protein